MNDEPRHAELRQEEDRIPPLPILLVFGLVGLIGIFLGVWAWYALQRREHALRPSGKFPESELGPRHPVSEIHQNIYGNVGPGQILNEQKRKEISSFEWIDRRRRIVSIPIDDAIALMLDGRRP